jgi:endonuclease YncB( thermonuclease family)
MVGIAHWAVDYRETRLVRYVFEAGAIGRRQVEKMLAVLYKDPRYRELCRIGAWSFAPKTDFLELQPADFYAYEIYKHMDTKRLSACSR